MQIDIFTLLVAILYLGNVAFDEDTEGYVCGVHGVGQDNFKTASHLLGIDEVNLLSVISKRNMHVNGSVIVKPQTLLQVFHLLIYYYFIFIFQYFFNFFLFNSFTTIFRQ